MLFISHKFYCININISGLTGHLQFSIWDGHARSVLGDTLVKALVSLGGASKDQSPHPRLDGNTAIGTRGIKSHLVQFPTIPAKETKSILAISHILVAMVTT